MSTNKSLIVEEVHFGNIGWTKVLGDGGGLVSLVDNVPPLWSRGVVGSVSLPATPFVHKPLDPVDTEI